MKNRDRHNLRDIYAKTITRLASKDSRIVMLDADSKEATKTFVFSRKFPDRSFSFGIAEQNMVTAAGGMAVCGLKPYVNTYSMFIAMRALDQVRNSIAYPNLDVTFVVSHHGLDVGNDGVTHQLIEDIAVMRAIPNMTILIPADASEMKQMIEYTLSHKGPFYIKSGKSLVPNVHKRAFKWKIGVPNIIADGERIAIVSCGVMLEKALLTRERLIKDRKAAPKVINVNTIKPLKEKAMHRVLSGINSLIVCEDHSIYGGLGGLMAEFTGCDNPIDIFRIGVRDVFAEAGRPDLLFEKYGMGENAIYRAVISAIESK